MAGISELDLSHNSFKTLPVELAQLSSLRILRLNDNQKLSNIDVVSKLTNLEKLFIKNTNLTKLNHALKDLKMLRQGSST